MRKKLLKLGLIAEVFGMVFLGAALLILLLGFAGTLVNLAKGLGVNLGPLANAKLPTMSATAEIDPTTQTLTSISVTA